MNRTSFPVNGIYTVRKNSISSTYYLNEEDARRYRYIQPAPGISRAAWVADCWIVDRDGNLNPGTNRSAIPFRRDNIGKRLR